jgi:hypothetical protein
MSRLSGEYADTLLRVPLIGSDLGSSEDCRSASREAACSAFYSARQAKNQSQGGS